MPANAKCSKRRGPPIGGDVAYWREHVFSADDVVAMCRALALTPRAEGADHAANLLNDAASMMFLPEVALHASARDIVQWGARVAEAARSLDAELRSEKAPHYRTGVGYLELAALSAPSIPAADNAPRDPPLTREELWPRAMAEAVARRLAPQAENPIGAALRMVPDALALLIATADILRVQPVPTGRPRGGLWRSFASHAGRAYKAVTGAEVTRLNDRESGEVVSPSIRFMELAAQRLCRDPRAAAVGIKPPTAVAFDGMMRPAARMVKKRR